MLSDDFRNKIKQPVFMIRMMWMSQFLALVIYYVIVHLVITKGQAPQEDGKDGLVPILGIIGGICLIAGIVFCRFVFSQRRAQGILSQGANPVPTQDLSPKEQSLLMLATKTLQFYIISLGLLNACGFTGLLAGIFTYNSSIPIPFLAAEAVALLFCPPKLMSFLEESVYTRQQDALNNPG